MKIKQLSFLVTISLFVWGFYSCDPCMNVKCAEVYGVQFTLKDGTTNNPLFFGANPAYHKDSLQIFQLINGDTTKLEITYVQDANGLDTLISTYTYYPSPFIYVQLNATDIDTIKLSYTENKENSDCCPNSQLIETIQYNNSSPLYVHQSGVKTGFYK